MNNPSYIRLLHNFIELQGRKVFKRSVLSCKRYRIWPEDQGSPGDIKLSIFEVLDSQEAIDILVKYTGPDPFKYEQLFRDHYHRWIW